MSTSTPTFEQHLARLGEAIAADGIDHHEVELAAVAARARRWRAAPAATEVLVDRSAPAVVRARAFARVCLALAAAAAATPIEPTIRTAAA